MPEYETLINTAPGLGSGIGNRSTSSLPGAFITAARTVVLMPRDSLRKSCCQPTACELERYRIQTCALDRKSTRLNSSHANISYAVFCLKKKMGLAGFYFK